MDMTAAYISRDGHWRVHSIILNGQPLIRIEADHPVMPVGEPAGRTGPIQGPGGWWKQEDVRHISQIERYVPLAELLIEGGS